MAVCDANYKFIFCDIGQRGRNADGGIYSTSKFAEEINDASNPMNIPAPAPLPGREKRVPYYLVADDAFTLCESIMKPYPLRGLGIDQRIFNYRLSRARRCIENAFGILSARWRILRSSLEVGVEKTIDSVAACCALHNYLLTRTSHAIYAPESFVDHELNGTHVPGDWRLEHPDIATPPN